MLALFTAPVCKRAHTALFRERHQPKPDICVQYFDDYPYLSYLEYINTLRSGHLSWITQQVKNYTDLS